MFVIDILLSILHLLLVFYLILFIAAPIFQLVTANPTNPIVAFCEMLTRIPRAFMLQRFPQLDIKTEKGSVDMSGLVLAILAGILIIITEKIQLYLNFF